MEAKFSIYMHSIQPTTCVSSGDGIRHDTRAQIPLSGMRLSAILWQEIFPALVAICLSDAMSSITSVGCERLKVLRDRSTAGVTCYIRTSTESSVPVLRLFSMFEVTTPSDSALRVSEFQLTVSAKVKYRLNCFYFVQTRPVQINQTTMPKLTPLRASLAEHKAVGFWLTYVVGRLEPPCQIRALTPLAITAFHPQLWRRRSLTMASSIGS